MTNRHIWLNLGGLGLMIALLGLVYWLNTGARAVPEWVEMLRTDDVQRHGIHTPATSETGGSTTVFRNSRRRSRS